MNKQFQVSILGARKQTMTKAILKPKTQYRVELKNLSSAYCVARLTVDGISIGSFQLAPGESQKIERPYGRKGIFTFGVGKRANVTSKIEARFVPEKKCERMIISLITNPRKDRIDKDNPRAKPLRKGATTLTGRSEIVYGTVFCSEPAELEEDKAVELTMQLAAA